jgi:hypothetical protein
MKQSIVLLGLLALVAHSTAFPMLGEGNAQELGASINDIKTSVSGMDDMEQLERDEEAELQKVKDVLEEVHTEELGEGYGPHSNSNAEEPNPDAPIKANADPETNMAAVETAQKLIESAIKEEGSQQVKGERSVMSLKQGMKDMAAEEKDLSAHNKVRPMSGEVRMVQTAEKEANQVSKTLEQGLEGHTTSDRLKRMSKELNQIHSAMSNTKELGEGNPDSPKSNAEEEPNPDAPIAAESQGALSLLNKVQKEEANAKAESDFKPLIQKVMAQEKQAYEAEQADVSEIDSLEKMLK